MNLKMKFRLKILSAAVCLMMFFQTLISQTINDGIRQFQMENYQSAIKIFKVLIASQPYNPDNYYQLGNVYCAIDKYDSATIIYNLGVTNAPKGFNNFIGLGKVLLSQNKTDEAITQFTKAKSLTSAKDINLYIDLADAYANNKNPNGNEAINNCKKGEEITTKDARLYLVYADAYLALKNSGGAVTNFENAARLDATIAYPYVAIGQIWVAAKNFSLALDYLMKAKNIDSSFATLWRELAEANYNMNKIDDATKDIEKFLSLADKSDQNLFRYAQLLFLSKQYDKANQILIPLMKNNPDNTTMMRLAGYADYELGNFTDGQSEMEKFFAKRDPKEVIASDFQYYGRLLMKNNRDSLAAINFEKAIVMDSNMCVLWSELANKNYGLKNYPDAAKYFQKAVDCSSKPDIKDVMTLGRSYYFDSAYAKADTAFMMATNIAPDWPIGYRWRAICNLNLDDAEKPQGLAIPLYVLMIEKAEKDSVKYLKELKEGYKYLGDIFTFNEQYDKAVYYYTKYLSLDPENADVKNTLDSIKKIWKGN